MAEKFEEYYQQFKEKTVADLIAEAKALMGEPATDERIDKTIGITKAYKKKSEAYSRDMRNAVFKSFDKGTSGKGGLEELISKWEDSEKPGDDGHDPIKTSGMLMDILKKAIPSLTDHGYAINEHTTDQMLYDMWEKYTDVAAQTIGIAGVEDGQTLRGYISELISKGEYRKARDVIRDVFAHHKANTDSGEIWRYLMPQGQEEYHSKLARKIADIAKPNIDNKDVYDDLSGVGNRKNLIKALNSLADGDYKAIKAIKPKDYTPRPPQ